LCKKGNRKRCFPFDRINSGQTNTKHKEECNNGSISYYRNDEFLHGLLTRDEGLAKLLEQVLNQILEAQVEEQLGARRY
jgi:hypothetical protein